MSILKNKILVKLIASICLILTIFNFSGINKVRAESWGGVLLEPVTMLLTSIGDAIMDVLHKAIRKQDTSLIKINGDSTTVKFLKRVALIVGGIVTMVVVAFLVIYTGGLATAAAAAFAGEAVTITVGLGAAAIAGGLAATIVCVKIGNDWIKDDIYVPAFTVSAEEIFANRIPVFDVNFFSPMAPEEVVKSEKKIYLTDVIIYYGYSYNEGNPGGEIEELTDLRRECSSEIPINLYNNYIGVIVGSKTKEEIYEELNDRGVRDNEEFIYLEDLLEEIKSYLKSNKPELTATDVENIEDWNMYASYFTDRELLEKTEEQQTSYQITITISDDANYDEVVSILFRKQFNETTKQFNETIEKEFVNINSTAAELRNIVATWYYVLRNLALIVLMLVLVYSGIRIVIGSTAGEKAKYKERLMDWLIAMCLVMIMHYIMVFAIEVVNKITELIDGGEKNSTAAYIPLTKAQLEHANTINWEKYGEFDEIFPDDSSAEGGKALLWPTDLLGLFRIQAQLENEGSARWVAYSFCYVVLVLMTLFFAFTYMKRIIYLAFLTIIAPLVAMTYPIDKITDGKAQAFDAWLKEYIFNLMIQPLHFLLYTILISSAFQLAAENVIYALVAIGFMMPAERLMRKFFGFEKAKTPGLLGGAAGAAIAMSGLQGILKHKPHGGKQGGQNGKSKDTNKIKFANKSKGNAMDDMTGMKPGTSSGGATTGGTAAGGATQARTMGASGGTTTQANSAGNFANSASESYEVNEEDIIKGTAAEMEWEDNGGFESLGEETPNTGVNAAEEEQGEEEFSASESDDDEGDGKRHIWRAIGTATLGAGKQAAVGVLTGIHPLKLGARIAGAEAAGLMGLAIGVASGDPSKAFQYTTGAAMAGSSLAGSLMDSNGGDLEKIKQDTQMAYYGSDYKKHMIEKQKEEFLSSGENINYLRQVLGVSHSDAKKILEETGGKCFDNGITDIKDVAAMHKLTHDGRDSMTFEKASAARTYAKKRLGGAEIDQMTSKQVSEYQRRWSKEFQERYNITEAQANKLARQSFDAAIKFNKASSGLTKG